VSPRRALAAAALALAALPLHAAPLDALLSAWPERLGPRAQLEIGADRVNKRIDFSQPDDDPLVAAAAENGDYRGAHLLGAWQVREGWWLSGGLWQRRLSDGTDTYRYRSWQLSGLVRLHEGQGALPALALRASAWGSRSDSTTTNTPVRVPGAVLDSVTITRPSDRQLQLDLVGTWTARPGLDASAVLGVGRTRLGYGRLAATTTRNGCLYDLAFNGNDIFGELAGPCSAPGVIEQFYDRSGDYGVDVAQELAWRGRFVQGGVNLAWREGPWMLRGGVLWHRVDRGAIDRIVQERGQRAYRGTRLIALEGAYQVHEHLALLLRLEASSHLFVAELPVTYNSGTAGRFGGRFSQLTLGLRAGF
jgi:hypothetical protein